MGPAGEMEGSQAGKEIENFDLVARVNHGWPVPLELQRDLGHRMDLLFHCCNGDYPIQRLFAPEFIHTRAVFYERGLDAYFLKLKCKELNIPNTDITDIYSLLNNEIGSHPSTGLAAIYTLLQFPVKKLFVTGFTFFQTPYHLGYLGAAAVPGEFEKIQKSGKVSCHEVLPQISFFRSLLAADNRIVCDPVLKKVISSTDGVRGSLSNEQQSAPPLL